MTIWLKLAHIAALTIWCGGLLVLPSLFAQRPGISGNAALYHLQRFTRHAFVELISPAAFIAVATGIALIFVREAFTPWMALKLVAVGVLVVLHLRAGYVIQRVFEPDRHYPAWRRILSLLTVAATVLAILFLVLAKPPLDLEALPEWLHRPGALQDLLDTMMPIP